MTRNYWSYRTKSNYDGVDQLKLSLNKESQVYSFYQLSGFRCDCMGHLVCEGLSIKPFEIFDGRFCQILYQSYGRSMILPFSITCWLTLCDDQLLSQNSHHTWICLLYCYKSNWTKFKACLATSDCYSEFSMHTIAENSLKFLTLCENWRVKAFFKITSTE